MRAVTLATLAVAAGLPAGAALAQPAPPAPTSAPAPQARSCDVTFSRSPEDVRRVIEHWIRAEPRCATSLDLRVIPTDGGLYLFARDAAGRIHERVVPDAQSAGVLVASWVADDSVSWGPTPAPAAAMPDPAPEAFVARGPAPGRPAFAPVAFAPAGAPVAAGPELAPPGEIAPIARPGRPSRQPRWLSAGAMVQRDNDEGLGLRAELGVVGRGAWTIGAALAVSFGQVRQVDGDLSSGKPGRDVRALATLSRSFRSGPWQLRLQGGLGIVYTTIENFTAGNPFTFDEPMSADGLFVATEGSVMLGRELGRSWAIDLGPMLTWYAQKLAFPEYDHVTYRAADLTAFLGIRRRL